MVGRGQRIWPLQLEAFDFFDLGEWFFSHGVCGIALETGFLYVLKHQLPSLFSINFVFI